MKTLPLQSLAHKTETSMCWMWANILFDSCPFANVFRRWRRCSPASGCCENAAPCASSPEQGWGVAGFLKALVFGVSNTITIAAYSPGRAATGSTISMPTGDNTGCVTWKQWQRNRRALCLSVLQQHRHCRPAMGRGTEQHSVGPTSTPSHDPCLVCFIQTLYTPQHTNTHASRMFCAFKMRKNSTDNTWSSDTVDVLPGCNGPDPLLPTLGPM